MHSSQPARKVGHQPTHQAVIDGGQLQSTTHAGRKVTAQPGQHVVVGGGHDQRAHDTTNKVGGLAARGLGARQFH